MRPAREVPALRLLPRALENYQIHLVAGARHRINQWTMSVVLERVHFRHDVELPANRGLRDQAADEVDGFAALEPDSEGGNSQTKSDHQH